MKIFRLFIAFAAMLAAVGCSEEPETLNTPALPVPVPVQDQETTTPTSIRITWPAVENAAGYDYMFDGKEAVRVEGTEVDIDKLTPDTKHTFKLRAVSGDPALFADSEWSAELTVSTLKSDTPPEGEGPFELEILETTFYNARVAVTPDDDRMTYYFSYLPKRDFDATVGGDLSVGTDRAVMEQAIYAIQVVAEASGKTFGDMFLILKNEGSNVFEIKDLAPETEFVAYAFGFNIEGEITSAMSKVVFSTESAPETPTSKMTFEVTVDKSDRSATVSVVPSVEDEYYFFAAVNKTRVPGSTDEAILKYYIDLFNEYVEENGFEAVAADNFSMGPDSYSYRDNLEPENTYRVYTFGVASYGGRVVATTPLRTDEFVTDPDPGDPVTDLIEITITQLTETGIDAVFRPRSSVEMYLCDIVPAADIEGMGDEQIAAYIVDLHGGPEEAWYTVQRETFEMKNMLGTYKPDTEYVVLAFGVDDNLKANTEIYRKVVRTLPSGETPEPDPVEQSIRVEVIDTTESGVSVRFTPSGDLPYIAQIRPWEEYRDLSDDQLLGRIVEDLGFELEGYLVEGETLLEKKDCTAGTEYVVLAFSWNPETAEPLSLHKQVVKTDEAAAVDPAADIRIEVTEVTATKIKAVFTPKDPTMEYVARVVRASVYQSKTDEQIIEAIIDDMGYEIYYGLQTGMYAYENSGDFDPATEYLVIAFGASSSTGEATTPLYKQLVTTQAAR